MERKSRIHAALHALAALPTEVQSRSEAAHDALAALGFAHVGVFAVDDRHASVSAGDAGGELASGAAAQAVAVARSGRMAYANDPRQTPGRFCAVPVGSAGDGVSYVLAVADGDLTLHEAQAIAIAAAGPTDGQAVRGGGACGELAAHIAGDFCADLVVISLFAQAGMLLSVHTRSGDLLYSWRCPADTVWGEAARHGAAFSLGELQMHPGAEGLAAVGMRSVAVAGLENGAGVAIGAIGIASARQLSPDAASGLLAAASSLGPRIMDACGRSEVPTVDETGAVEMRAFATRVGCRRFAVYTRANGELSLSAAFAEDGTRLVAPPHQHEEYLVQCAIARGVGLTTDDAAAIPVGDDTVLYAHDPATRPMDRLRLALQDMHANPYGKAA